MQTQSYGVYPDCPCGLLGGDMMGYESEQESPLQIPADNTGRMAQLALHRMTDIRGARWAYLQWGPPGSAEVSVVLMGKNNGASSAEDNKPLKLLCQDI